MKDAQLLRLLREGPDVRDRSGRVRKQSYTGPNGPSKWQRRVIVGWDGEGANVEDTGEHIYNLLANSNGDHILNHEGLSTEQALAFCMNHSDPKDINVIFGGSYDVNMILRDLSRDHIKELWVKGSVKWRGWRINYTPRRKFSCSNWKVYGQRSFVLWDVIGYFQTSFVSACDKWLKTDMKLLAGIQVMKVKRGEFTTENIAEIIVYNSKECDLLVKLVTALFDSLDEAGISLVRYDGAGSIAAALLKANDIKRHMGTVPPEVYEWARHAYSGGRIEATMIGNTPEDTPIYRADINSAYPAVAVDLPSYENATWSLDKEWDGSDHSLVRVEFNDWYTHIENHLSPANPGSWSPAIDCMKEISSRPFHPLFYRNIFSMIYYPPFSTGVYWGVEVKNLVEFYPKCSYKILGAYNVTLRSDVKPFAFLQKAYDQRRVFKDRGSMASEALKLGINSVYGKLAQQAGYRADDGPGAKIPTYHQLLWAGQITATTRAKMFKAAMQCPESVIAFATDAIISLKELDVPESTKMGDWTKDKFNGITIVQPGVYFLKPEDPELDPKGDAVWNQKYRGFDRGSLSRVEIVECWRKKDEYYEAPSTRFVTMGGALALKDEDFRKYWRTWHVTNRKLRLAPWIGGKRREADTGRKRKRYHERLEPTIANDPGDLTQEFSVPPNWPLEKLHSNVSKAFNIVWITGSKDAEGTGTIDKNVIEEENDAYE
jgi:hypothetical protein